MAVAARKGAADLLHSRGVAVSRLAFGQPSGSAVEYVDATTLQHAIEGHQKLKKSRCD